MTQVSSGILKAKVLVDQGTDILGMVLEIR